MKLATVALNGAGDRVALVEDHSVYPFLDGMTMREVIHGHPSHGGRRRPRQPLAVR
jgi:hypothetical protein